MHMAEKAIKFIKKFYKSVRTNQMTGTGQLHNKLEQPKNTYKDA